MEIYSNIAAEGARRLSQPEDSVANTVIDYGAEDFTEGRPHPIIDSTIRDERVRAEAGMHDVSVVILDLVLGYGAPRDAATRLKERLTRNTTGDPANVVVHPVAARSDPQTPQLRELERLGVKMVPSNALAAILGAAIASGDAGIARRLAEKLILEG